MEISSMSTLAQTLANAASGVTSPTGAPTYTPTGAPTGTSSPEVVRRFESALEGPSLTTEIGETGGPTVESAESAESAAPSSAHSVLDALGRGELSHTDLLQVQFTMGMLKTQSTGGVKGSQQLTQDMEALMKQQG